MSDFILIVLTAEGCEHCHHSRGDGLLGNDKHFMQYDYLKKLMKQNDDLPDITVLNIHFLSMSGNQTDIKDISKFKYLNNSIIQQERYYNKDGYANVLVKSVTSKNKVSSHGNKEILVDDKKIIWQDFVDKKISKKLENYTFYYPCFILFRKDDWVKNKDFLGITNSGNIILDTDGVYKLEKNPQTLSQRSVDPENLVLAALTGNLKFEPHKNLFQPKEEPKKEEPKKEEPKKEEPKKEENNLGFIIKNYNDEL